MEYSLFGSIIHWRNKSLITYANSESSQNHNISENLEIIQNKLALYSESLWDGVNFAASFNEDSSYPSLGIYFYYFGEKEKGNNYKSV